MLKNGLNIENPKIKTFLNSNLSIYKLYIYYINFFISEEMYNTTKNIHNQNMYTSKGLSYMFKQFKYYTCNILINRHKLDNSLNNIDILFISRYRVKKYNNIKSDYLFDNILKNLDSNYKCGLISLDFTNRRYNRPNIYNYNLLNILSFKNILKSLMISANIILKYNLLRYRLDNSNKALMDHIFTKSNILAWCLIDTCLDGLFKSTNPKIVIANDDVHIKIKPENSNFKLIVLQSAQINEINEIYRNDLFFKFITEKQKSDLYCVSGEYYKLIKQKYSSDTKEIIIVGQPRFDELAYLRDKYYNKYTNNNYNKNNITILWATEPDLSMIENEKNIKAIDILLSKITNIRLLIKLHPGDENKYLYEPLTKKYSSIELYDGETNFYELLSCCDILITKHSTSAIEAAILNKDIIILDFSNTNHPFDYLKEGIALGVFKENDLVTTVDSIFYNESVKNNLKNARDKYVYTHAYLIDGKSSERISNIIIKMINDYSVL